MRTSRRSQRTLEYAPAAPGGRLRRLARGGLVLALLVLIPCGWYWHQPIWDWLLDRGRIAQAAWVQRGLMTFSYPPDTLVVDGPVHRIGYALALPGPGDPASQFAQAVKPLPPIPQLDRFTAPIKGRLYLSPTQMMLLHERRRPDGTSRLLAVTVRSLGGRLDISCHVLEPGTFVRPARHLSTHDLAMVPFGQIEADLQLFAGRPDPGDPSAVIIPFETADQSGEIRLLLDNADRLHVEGDNLAIGRERATSNPKRVSTLIEFPPASFGLSSLSAEDARELDSPIFLSAASDAVVTDDRVTMLSHGILASFRINGDHLEPLAEVVPPEREAGKPYTPAQWGGGISRDGRFALVTNKHPPGWLRLYEINDAGLFERVASHAYPRDWVTAVIDQQLPTEKTPPRVLLWQERQFAMLQAGAHDASPELLEKVHEVMAAHPVLEEDQVQLVGTTLLLRRPGRVILFDVDTGQLQLDLPQMTHCIGISLSPDATKLAAVFFGRDGNHLRLIDARTGDTVRRYPLEGISQVNISGPRWSADGSWLVLDTRDGHFVLSATEPPHVVRVVPPESASPQVQGHRLWMSGNGRRVLMGLSDKRVLIYELPQLVDRKPATREEIAN